MSLPSGRGSSPRIHVTNTQDKGIRAECTSAGWYPEPKVEWLDLKGRPVPAETHFSVSTSTGLLAVLSIATPQDRAVAGLTCSISNPLLPGKVTETYLLGEYLFSSTIKDTRTRPWVPGMLEEGYADRTREVPPFSLAKRVTGMLVSKML